MDMQSKRGKALSVVTAATLAASLGVPALAVADEANGNTQVADAQASGQERANVVDEMIAGQAQQPVEGAAATVDGNPYATLAEAIAAAKKGGVVEVQRNLTADQVTSDSQNPYILIAEQGTNVTIDLNGNSIQLNAEDTIAVKASDVTLKIIDGSIENTAANGYGLYVYNNKATGAGYDDVDVVFEGVTLTTKDQAIGVQGLNSNNNVTLKNCVINANKSLGAYWPPKSGVLTLDGTTINAGTGLMVKGGQIKVLGKTVINADGDRVIPEEYYNGDPAKSIDLTGDAVYMESGYNDRPIVIDIESGTFNSKNNLAVRYFTKPTQTAPERTYKITGGSFSSELSVEYVGAGAAMLVNEDGRADVMAEAEAEKRAGAYVEKDGKKVYYTSVKAAQDANPDNADAVVSYCAQIGDAKYGSLSEAIAAAGDGQTVTLTSDVVDGPGVIVGKDEKKNVVIDFAGHAYTVTKAPAGSSGTKNQCFQLLEGSTVVMKNGVITGDMADLRMIIQNYADLTLDGMTLDATQGTNNVGYVLSLNCGKVSLKGDTNIIAKQGKTAIDASYWPSAYPGGAQVVVNTEGRIVGDVELGLYGSNGALPLPSTTKLSIENVSHEGKFVKTVGQGDYATGLTEERIAETFGQMCEITGGSFATDPGEFVADGYKANESNGKWTVSAIVPPAPPAPQPDTDVEQRPDGSTVTTVTKPDGSQTVTTEAADGSQSVVSKDADGNVTSTEVSVSDKAAEAGEVVLPLDSSKPAADAGKAPAVEVKVPASVAAEAPVKVTVPVDADEPDYGVVVFAVDADGNETVLPKCGVDADGNVVFEATGDVTIKVAGAASEFPDVAGTWYGKQGVADFVSARGILTGVPQADGALRFEGDAAATRAMFVTMLHRAESCPDAEGAGFDDAAGLWFEEAAAWGEATGVVDGYGGSSFGGDDPVTREQMAVFLMRYAEHLGLDTSARADLSEFPDGSETSTWASRAMSWAVAEGLFSGRDGRLDPTDGATRAEASAVVMRFINGLYA